MQFRGGRGSDAELLGATISSPDGTILKSYGEEVLTNDTSVQEMLREIIQSAWEECVKSDYDTLRINSERSLQASFWSQLNSRLKPKEYWRMFIEPGLKLANNDKRFPDLVICETDCNKVVAVIELKYQPRIKGKWKKDIRTLDWIHTHRNLLYVRNVRHDKGGVSPKYMLDEDALFVWAGIHLPLKQTICEQMDDSEWKCNFMELHHPTEKRRKK